MTHLDDIAQPRTRRRLGADAPSTLDGMAHDVRSTVVDVAVMVRPVADRDDLLAGCFVDGEPAQLTQQRISA